MDRRIPLPDNGNFIFYIFDKSHCYNPLFHIRLQANPPGSFRSVPSQKKMTFLTRGEVIRGSTLFENNISCFHSLYVTCINVSCYLISSGNRSQNLLPDALPQTSSQGASSHLHSLSVRLRSCTLSVHGICCISFTLNSICKSGDFVNCLFCYLFIGQPLQPAHPCPLSVTSSLPTPNGLVNRQIAWAEIPSPVPVKPSPSSVVAFTFT